MPSWELFEEQPEGYRRQVLPPGVPKLAVGAGATLGWWKYVGDRGQIIGFDHFGASAPASTVFQQFGFTVDNVVEKALALARR